MVSIKKILLLAPEGRTERPGFDASQWVGPAKQFGYEVVSAFPETTEGLIEYLTVQEPEIEIIASSFYTMGHYHFTPEVIARVPSSVKAVMQAGAGYEMLGPMDAWKKKGIVVCNSPTGVTKQTSNAAIYLILGATRHFNRATTNLRNGKWRGDADLGLEPEELTVGIVGMGGIGRLIRDKLRALDFKKVQYYNRRRLSPELEKDSVHVSYEELIETSDVILFVVPHNKHTHHMFNAETIAKTKKGVVVVNIGRGPVVDEQALVDGLESGHIASVGLDVYEHEPKVNPGLIKSPDALLLPHIAAFTTNLRASLEKELIENFEHFANTGTLLSLVPEMRD